MEAQLYPLLFKSGIKRDGTTFQGEYCTDGQWVRWQRGNVRKIGGMLGLNLEFQLDSSSNIFLIQQNTQTIFVYLMNSQNISFIKMNTDMQALSPAPNPIATFTGYSNLLWQALVIVNAGKQQIIFLGTNNKTDILNNSAPHLFVAEPFDTRSAAIKTNGVQKGADGGFCYVHPFLFLYGSEGTVKVSANNNPFDFEKNSQILTISSDKVIYGSPVRGGSASPCLLFWTLSSVVRITNVGVEALNFKQDIIAQSVSILSSRCVVEYDGFFFWPGTDRFFVYNGIVSEIPNAMNLNYFFNNLDITRRQEVFGVKNTKYGEIWWFYPVKGIPGNSRAIIYNKRENFWYDTAISRICGMFFETNGVMYSFGKKLTPLSNEVAYLFAHEQGSDEVIVGKNPAPILSYFTTPIFSFASFNPLKQVFGVDKWTYLQRIEPDFIMGLVQDDAAKKQKITLVVQTKKYAQDDFFSHEEIKFLGNTGKIDLMVQGRQIRLTFYCDSFFELGHSFLLLSFGDGQ